MMYFVAPWFELLRSYVKEMLGANSQMLRPSGGGVVVFLCLDFGVILAARPCPGQATAGG